MKGVGKKFDRALFEKRLLSYIRGTGGTKKALERLIEPVEKRGPKNKAGGDIFTCKGGKSGPSLFRVQACEQVYTVCIGFH